MKRIVSLLAALILLGTTVTAYAARDGAEHAAATLYNTNGEVIGWARFTEDAAGVIHVNVKVQGLAPGLHGLHLHAVAACSPTFAAAGGHHNPLGHQHGLDNPNGAHGGDLPNLVVNAAGQGHLNAATDRATLSAGPVSLFDADGSSLIIHAAEDDQVTDPTGNSGGRIACGILQAE
jgi:Cu-Zn family superoxide dismutase